ncbi:tyrosine-type recombinase/integrase [Paucibacter sp. B2R-40]|uniref:tyrosine-type recombinase/integrase n=1 Tax=Paucibacter sp. B2R-40 TaxID=2893554 RepID=UPI0021E394CC|nr:tyrosine-type recombinase/integrase [Paucibacter sp. B2R-40]MCV2355114.1 tyrosine-type recombinase/integrase [Paucibacter sp. B2R-40]
MNKQLEAEWSMLEATPDGLPKTIKQRAADLLKEYDLVPGSATNNESNLDVFREHLDVKRERHAGNDEDVYRDAPGSDYLAPHEIEAAQQMAGTSVDRLSDALALYLKTHKRSAEEKFTKPIRARFAQLVDLIGDKPVADADSDDGKAYLDKLLATGVATTTARRYLRTMHSILAKYLKAKKTQHPNPFADIEIPHEGEDAEKAKPYSAKELSEVLKAVKATDDEARWLVAMLADTGARLSEIAGLTLADIDLQDEVPRIHIRFHAHRRIKNLATVRYVPLKGCALWAATRIKATATKDQRYAFPHYNTKGTTNGNSASATLNKWVKETVGVDHNIHELRHTMADRLRRVQCPADIRLAIGGWARPSVGEGYGDGYPLEVAAEWLAKATG